MVIGFKNLRKSYQVYLLLLPLAVLVAVGVLLFSGRGGWRFDETSCDCGLPSSEETGEYQKSERAAIFSGKTVGYQISELTPTLEALEQQEGAILGATTDERWVEIDLSDQKLYAHNGDSIDYEFLISSGKWAPTPTGDFRIWIKLKYTKMEGGRRGTNTYYYLPNVPYTQYFYKGYGLHGTYWHNNFGHPMSHGCVNLATPDAEKLFYWTSPVILDGKAIAHASKDNPGTRVVVHD